MERSKHMLEAVGLGRKSRDAWLLKDINLALGEGSRVGLTGPSGSGKTVLLRSLAMLDPFEQGTIRWQAKEVEPHATPAFRAACIYLQQKPSFQPGSVREVLRFPFSLQIHRSRQFDQAKIVRWLERTGREASFLEKQTTELSGGESQIVALLRALQLDPAVLLLDEPTSALDAYGAGAAEQLIRDWHQANSRRAYIIVGHDPAHIARMSDRQIYLKAGRIEENP